MKLLIYSRSVVTTCPQRVIYCEGDRIRYMLGRGWSGAFISLDNYGIINVNYDQLGSFTAIYGNYETTNRIMTGFCNSCARRPAEA